MKAKAKKATGERRIKAWAVVNGRNKLMMFGMWPWKLLIYSRKKVAQKACVFDWEKVKRCEIVIKGGE